MTGEIVPDEGTVELDGEPIGARAPDSLARRRACLPQASTLSFPFRIREVVGIGRLPHMDTNKERERRIDEALGEVGLLDRDEENYMHLSGGEKQRVHLARVLAQLGRPEGSVLLLDEPTASLDLTFQQLVFRIAADWAARGAVVAMVLHDLNQAMRHGDSVAVLHRGRLVASGAPAEVLGRDLLARVYGVRADWIESGCHRLLAVEGPLERELYETNEH
jgi:iron complex transport system ATP-binding protein